jgi:hypothetical protein
MMLSEDPPPYDSDPDTVTHAEIPSLPHGVTLAQIYADFLKFIFQSTRDFFQENNPNGSEIWNRVQNRIIIVLCTPNGWDASQQAFLRDAAVMGGLVDTNNAHLRLDFVTEGEASVHYALAYTSNSTWLKRDVMFMVADAGGSTVDSTLYECKQDSPKLVLEEVCASQCVQVNIFLLK